MKTQEELNILKEEVEAMNEKLKELTEEEIEEVVGGAYKNFQTDLGKLATDNALPFRQGKLGPVYGGMSSKNE